MTCSKFIQRQWLLLLKVLMLLQMLTLVQQVKLYGCITMKVKITSSQVLPEYCKHFTHSYIFQTFIDMTKPGIEVQ